MYSKLNNAIIYAFNKGYRVTEEGNAINPNGKIIKGSITKKGYKKFNIRLQNRDTMPVFLHKLCAYQKFGDIVFAADCVRHIDGNPLNNAWNNIEIGTNGDNRMDMPKEKRKILSKHAASFLCKYNKNEIRKFYEENSHSYKKTMAYFGIKSKGTLWFILNK